MSTSAAPSGPMNTQDAAKLVGEAIGQVQRVIVGQEHMVEQLMVGLLAKGHILLEVCTAGIVAALRTEFG